LPVTVLRRFQHGVSGTTVNPAKTAEPIWMPIGAKTREPKEPWRHLMNAMTWTRAGLSETDIGLAGRLYPVMLIGKPVPAPATRRAEKFHSSANRLLFRRIIHRAK